MRDCTSEENVRGKSSRPAEDKGFGPTIPCGCGCEATLRQFDANGRERRYLNGHYLKKLKRLYAEATAKGLDMTR